MDLKISKIVTLPSIIFFPLLQREGWAKNHFIAHRQAYRSATFFGSKTLENIESGTERELKNCQKTAGKGDKLYTPCNYTCVHRIFISPLISEPFA